MQATSDVLASKRQITPVFINESIVVYIGAESIFRYNIDISGVAARRNAFTYVIREEYRPEKSVKIRADSPANQIRGKFVSENLHFRVKLPSRTHHSFVAPHVCATSGEARTVTSSVMTCLLFSGRARLSSASTVAVASRVANRKALSVRPALSAHLLRLRHQFRPGNTLQMNRATNCRRAGTI